MSVDIASTPSSLGQRVVGAYHIPDTPIHSSRIKRPRSTPVNATRPVTYHQHTVLSPENGLSSKKMNRPKTAAAVLGMTRDCDRVSQLEHEATRRHNLDVHTPIKKNKPPPWQAKIDPPLVPFVVGPGYILSKSKSKFAVTLKDEFFEPVQDEEVKKKEVDHERDTLISQLQQQISDLTLYLEEERLNHRQTKAKAEEFLKDKIHELQTAHRNAVMEAEEDGKRELENLRNQLETEHNNYKTHAEGQLARNKKEIEFLQGAFESYKSSLHQEMDDKWNRKKTDLTNELEQQKDKEIHEMRVKLSQEKQLEKSSWNKDHHRAMENLRKEHKRELDNYVRKFSNVAADLERLQKCTNELQETKSELAIVTQRYEETCSQLANVTRTLTDTKVRLLAFEEQFDLKVQEVDEKYKTKLEELMTQNTELKRLYVKKCGELYEEKNLFEIDRVQRVMTAKETMHRMLKSKHRAEVSLTPGNHELDNKQRKPKVRPGSAPITKGETENAQLSAGELDHLKQDEEVDIRPTVLLPEDSAEVEEMRKELMEDIKSMSKEELLKVLEENV